MSAITTCWPLPNYIADPISRSAIYPILFLLYKPKASKIDVHAGPFTLEPVCILTYHNIQFGYPVNMDSKSNICFLYYTHLILVHYISYQSARYSPKIALLGLLTKSRITFLIFLGQKYVGRGGNSWVGVFIWFCLPGTLTVRVVWHFYLLILDTHTSR